MGTDSKNLVGTTLAGRYRIERPIGEGGMGAIFAATQLSLGRAVAIKVVKCAHGDDSEAIRRFELETEVIARLAHPNVVQVVDAGRADDGTMFLAMELLDGDTVRAILRRVGTLPVPRALAVIDDVASALAAAHAGGVIHRDLKAENVMLVKAGKHEVAKVLDFGVAKLTARTEAPPQTGSGFVAGTPGCIAPEQMLGKSDDPRSDLYSVGVLLFEMLAGEAPFVASTSVELMMRHLTEPPPRVADVARARGRPEVPAAVDELVASLLSKDPDLRPKSADALGDIVTSMRDASRSTQPDLRLPTPQGGFAVPTPGSVVVPAVTPAPNELVTLTASTPMPVPGTAGQVLARGRPPFLKIAPRVAALCAIVAALGWGGLRGLAMWSDRAIPGWGEEVGEAWDRFQPLDEALLRLDVKLLKENAGWIVARGHEAPLAHIYLAHAAMLERAPLTVIDEHLAKARAMAERRSSPFVGRTHTALLVDALAEIDPVEAERKWRRHLEFSGCGPWHDAEWHLWAQKITFTEWDGARIAAAYTAIEPDVDEMAPITRLGYARGLRHQMKLDEAAAVLAPPLAKDPTNPILVEAMVDVELAQGKRDAAVARLEALLRGGDHARLALRLAHARGLTDRDAYDAALAYLRRLVDGNPQKAASLAAIGYAHAARGRFVEAEALWQSAAAAAQGDDTIIAELAVFASMFAAIAGEEALAKQWLDVYTERLFGVTDSASARRMQAFALGNRIMLALYEGKMGDASAQKDFERLQQQRIDVPFFADTIAWYVTLQAGKLDEALATAERLPLCFADLHAGIALLGKGDLAAAAERLDRATTPAREAYCTSGDDIVPYIQTITFAKALAWRGDVALRRGDRKDAAEALRRYRALWPFASAPSPPPGAAVPEWRQALARVEAAAAP